MNEAVLLDTDVASFFFEKNPHAKRFRPLTQGKGLALTFVSVAELFKWTLKRRWGTEKVAQLEVGSAWDSLRHVRAFLTVR
jgi:tRNA(fMet)-specific endonuclease VapC